MREMLQTVTWRVFAAVVSAVSLQGCNLSIPRHAIGNWEAKPNYLKQYEYHQPGQPADRATLNSCSIPDLSAALQCSGHGECQEWTTPAAPTDAGASKLAFCRCDRYYADPECTTARKSQAVAFILSLFFGMFGIDQLYLGYGWYFVAKLTTFGGCGLWYVFDVCRIGSSAVLTNGGWRVAADLPHFVFVVSALTATAFIAFAISIWSIRRQRSDKAHELCLLRDDPRHMQANEWDNDDSDATNKEPSFSGYGATLPHSATRVPVNATSSCQVKTVVHPPVTTTRRSPAPLSSSASIPSLAASLRYNMANQPAMQPATLTAMRQHSAAPTVYQQVVL